jgi:hypothetical protein
MSVNPFDPKTIVPAKHAQHVVLIHYPIALFLAGVAFDFLAQQSLPLECELTSSTLWM